MFTFFFVFIGFTIAWLAFDYFNRVPASATLTAAQAAERMDADGRIQVLDVRTASEFKSGHLKAALNIPVQQVKSRLAEIDKSRPLIVYCRSGHRSGLAMQTLLKQGFDACHIKGGILAWDSEKRPIQR